MTSHTELTSDLVGLFVQPTPKLIPYGLHKKSNESTISLKANPLNPFEHPQSLSTISPCTLTFHQTDHPIWNMSNSGDSDGSTESDPSTDSDQFDGLFLVSR
ncbi:hypothetical protein CROQUDRAFT_90690 [Cronartium quercuum f. sp. fusiforme G11]|uniref:Uncharacterized protein n=1 Tax=Cronartium quercuum f. sp. fusiforme G11 TaxID=708437 RepID=A0A9P6NLD7_9BASI|nr:hypothetical protein CROQUDRAFT_90690 [Cronartium quercuum f. sp. fusiforme G11]